MGSQLDPRRHEGESDDERLDRNWLELLQELRVAQTGVQILTGFLLTLPFASRFPDLATYQHYVYLAVLAGSVLSTGLLVAPVVHHRMLFRQGVRSWLVARAQASTMAGLVLLGLTIVGVAFFIFDVVLNLTAGFIAAGVALAFYALVWGLGPTRLRAATRVE